MVICTMRKKKAKNTVAINGEFGGTGTITDAATITVGIGAKIRADWGAVTLNKAPTVSALVDVVATEIPANNKVKLFAGTSFTQPDGWTTAYARVLVGATVHYGTVAVEADGVYATISDDAMTAAMDAAAESGEVYIPQRQILLTVVAGENMSDEEFIAAVSYLVQFSDGSEKPPVEEHKLPGKGEKGAA